MKPLLRRLRAWLRRDELDAEIHAELEHHLAMKQRAMEESGAGQDESNREARMALGNRTRIAEEARSAWVVRWMEEMWGDLRYSLRLLRKDRAFTFVSIVTLALAIGATTAIFSLMNALLWRPLEIGEPERLTRLVMTRLPPDMRTWVDGREVRMQEQASIPWLMLQSIQRNAEGFDGVFGLVGGGMMHAMHAGVPSRVSTRIASGNVFDVLKLKPQAGRFFGVADDVPGGGREGWPAVISDELFSAMFARDASRAIGARLEIERIPVVVTGIAPRGFLGLNPTTRSDLWLPASALDDLFPRFKWRTSTSANSTQAWARLKPGVSMEQAAGHLEAIAPRVMEESVDPGAPEASRKHSLARLLEPRRGASGFTYMSVTYEEPLRILLAAVGAVLLIAAINLASLFMARAAARRHELAVRVALGAPGGRLRDQLLMEALLVSTGGALGGLLIGQWLGSALQGPPASSAALLLETSLDWRMFAFAFCLLLFVTLVAGLAPAVAASRARPQAALKSGRVGPQTLRWRSGLAVVQCALALTLLSGAAAMVESLRGLVEDPTGMGANNTVFLTPDLFNAGVPRDRMADAYSQILEKSRTIPGVMAAGWAMTVPLSGSLSLFHVEVPGRSDLTKAQRNLYWQQIGDGYFAAVGLPIVAGTDLPPVSTGRKNAALVNETVAKLFFGSAERAVGQRIRPGNLPLTEIVGVVADAKFYSVRERNPPTIYLPYWNEDVNPGMTLAVRYQDSEEQTSAALTRIFKEQAGRLPLIQKQTLQENVGKAVGTERQMAKLLSGFSLLALAISALGLGGLLSYLVEQRRRDLGIRLALGARPGEIFGGVARLGLGLAGAGVVAGAILTYVLRRSLDSVLFGVTPADPRVWVTSVVILMTAAAAACAVPGWRASRIDPLQMLRDE